MAYQATVVSVMIASLIDVLNERPIAREVIHGWNYVKSMSRRMVLMSNGSSAMVFALKAPCSL